MNHRDNIFHYLYKLNDEEVSWTDPATKFDLSDQPHLIRYLKSSKAVALANDFIHNKHHY